jgi:hypothetical protein
LVFLSRFIHGWAIFLFKAEKRSTVYVCHILYIHLWIYQHLSCFYLSGTVKIVINFGVEVSVWVSAVNSCLVYIKKLNSWIIWRLFFTFWEIAKLFS